ncbi:hypothetical protein P7C70_g7145, partial [Phenoliferia sp. Uapishka_3]
MRSFAVPAVAAGLISLARAKAADFVQDSSAVSFDTGNYLITNVKTGKNLYMDRTDAVGMYSGSSTAGINLEMATISGTTGAILKGTTSDTLKCMAAQWNFADTGASRDEYAVPYACQVGSSGSGNTDKDSNKEIWIFNEVTCSGDASSSDDSSSASSSTENLAVKVKQNVAVTSTSSTEQAAAAATTTEAPSTDDSATTSAWAPTTTQSVDKQDQSTWVCQHPGWWLYAHQGYVTEAGHVECADDLADYKNTLSSRRMVRRSDRHAQIARRSAERAALEKRSTCYTITAVNHLGDMARLGLSGTSTTGYASMAAMELAVYDATDANQQWTVTSA